MRKHAINVMTKVGFGVPNDSHIIKKSLIMTDTCWAVLNGSGPQK